MIGPESTEWQDSERASLRLEALDYLNRLLSGQATDRDAAEFLTWRGQSRAHEAAFQSALRLRDLVRHVDGQREPVANAVHRDPVVVPIAAAGTALRGYRLPRRALIGGAIAASFAGGLFVAGRSLDIVPAPADLRADYRTGAGERRLVALAGGATAELNTRTSIALRTDLGGPAIDLIDGEVIVANRANSTAHRVAVIAGPGTSIGTAGSFSARRDGEQVCITCLAGRVDIAWVDQTRSLGPLDQLRYDDRRIGAVAIGADLVSVTAWRSGTLIFRDMPMRQVVAELNRYRPGKIFLANPQLAERSLSGTYDVRRLDDFFSQAELGLAVTVTRLPANVIILS